MENIQHSTNIDSASFFPPGVGDTTMNKTDKVSPLIVFWIQCGIQKSKGQWQLTVIESCVKEVLGLRGAHSRDLNSKCAFYSLEKERPLYGLYLFLLLHFLVPPFPVGLGVGFLFRRHSQAMCSINLPLSYTLPPSPIRIG